MSSTPLSTTAYAMLGMLAIQPWSTYELAQQMTRGVGRVWPRAESKLYEAPKQLVSRGLARAATEAVGRRRRTVYSITPQGRRALAGWLREPGAPPALEFEQLLKVFFAENGTTADALRTLAATAQWAQQQSLASLEIGRQYLAGEGPFPERLPELNLSARFLTDFYALVGEWARWATEVVTQWPDDPRAAATDRGILEETVRRAQHNAHDVAAPARSSRSPRARRQ